MRAGLLSLALCLAAHAHASTLGFQQIEGVAGAEPLTLFYPSTDAESPKTQGGSTRSLAVNGAVALHNGHLLVLSHGSGGSPWPLLDLARQLTDKGFVVAVPQHKADNWQDDSDAGPPSWVRRPHEVSQAIDQVGQLPAFAGQLNLSQVGVFGMSAGGHTALTLAGARWSVERLGQHCRDHLAQDYSACAGPFIPLRPGMLDEAHRAVARRINRWQMQHAGWHSHTDSRIRAIVAAVPFAADFESASLAHLQVPVALVQSQHDVWLRPAFHSAYVLQACANCTLLVDLPEGGHGAVLSPLRQALPPPLQTLMGDPSGYNRSQDTPRMHRQIADYFVQKLLP